MASIKYKTEDGYISIPLNIIGSRVYLEDYDDGEVIPELVDDNAKLGNGIGTCSTSSGNALEVTLDNYRLVKNGIVAVTFEHDVPANATLNINNKGAKAIYNEGSAIEANVIKAGKTVMFVYDGTNYVVTSLGGSGEDGEIVVVKCSTDDNAPVTGKTVTINGTLYTLDATGIASAKIPFGTQYSILASSWSGYDTPQTQVFTANLTLREVTVMWELDSRCVDLKLPSGLKWSKGYVCYDDGNYIINDPTKDGLFFSWGNTDGHTRESGYDYGANYNSTPGGILFDNGSSISSNDAEHDGVLALIGSPFHMPSRENIVELLDNTTLTWVTDYLGDGSNIAGAVFTSKLDSSKSIFFKACGDIHATTARSIGTLAKIWSSTRGTYVYDLESTNGTYQCVERNVGHGFNLRGVM